MSGYGGVDIPGPIDYNSASHYIQYDHANFTVETWCSMRDKVIRMRTRVRPMTEMEIILSKVRDHSREAVLKAFGVVETQSLPPHKKPGPFERLTKWIR